MARPALPIEAGEGIDREEETLLEATLADLAEKESCGHAVIQKPRHQQEVSPWLDLTR